MGKKTIMGNWQWLAKQTHNFFNSRFTFVQHCEFKGNFGCVFEKYFLFSSTKTHFSKTFTKQNTIQNTKQFSKNKTQNMTLFRKLLKPSYRNILTK
jgi:hypothetical protein